MLGLKSILAKFYAGHKISKLKNEVSNPHRAQKKVFDHLIVQGRNTLFGRDHGFNSIKSYKEFVSKVPLRDYEDLRPYIDKVVSGQSDVLWPDKPIYLCKTSGTTSGAKYIPISKESISNHIDSAKHALLSYINESGKSDFVDGKMIFLQGSPELELKGGIHLGRLSGIVAHHVPRYLQKNRVPTFETNCIADWEEKLDAIIEETHDQDLRLISGIPSWVQMYFERLLLYTGKQSVAEVFPNFSLLVHGGVNFEPYKPIFSKLIGKEIPSIETYPASEGFIAFQDSQNERGLLLVTNDGIFYEFVPLEEIHQESPSRIPLSEVKIGVNYAIVLNTNAGLWGYLIGDTVKFVSLDPPRIVVTGRVKHFISAFGEHVIAEEVETALTHAIENHGGIVKEFHVAPQVEPKSGLPHHEWFIEFESEPKNLELFASEMDEKLQSLNPYYKDLLQGNILRRLIISRVKPEGFIEVMKSRGKLGGQNKVPRLGNDRAVASQLEKVVI